MAAIIAGASMISTRNPARSQLTELVRRAEAGEEIVLTRHGRAAVRLVAMRPGFDVTSRTALLEAVRRSAAAKRPAGIGVGTDAARSQDFLYGEDGLPG